MNFGQTIAAVVALIKRPEKAEDIKLAINQAISEYTLGASFEQDRDELSLTINGTQYAQSVVISTAFIRFRRIDYLRRPAAKRVFKYCPPINVFDKDGIEAKDVYYRAGANLVLRLSALSSTLLCGYYQYAPSLVLDTDTHWMLDTVPDLIKLKAYSIMLENIGEPIDSRIKDTQAKNLYLVAKQDFEISGTITV
jgi:hypothetical protein